jgi:outer membrane lipoprotein SlyB
MNLPKIISSVVLSLLMSAFSTQAANIKIASLPFNITGTYVLSANLSYPSQQNVAITIPGAVILDLQGHTLSGGGGYSIAVGIGTFAGSTIKNSDPIIVQNGTLQNFGFGL